MSRFTLLRYFLIWCFLASHIPFTWLIINWESPWMTADSTFKDLANSNPIRRVSYSASLLVVWYYRQVAYFNLSPSGNLSITSIPPTYNVDEPSTLTTNLWASSTSFSSTWLGVNSTMKSPNTCAFIAFLGWYLTSNSLSSMVHWISRPATSNLFIAFFSGWSVKTLMTWI